MAKRIRLEDMFPTEDREVSDSEIAEVLESMRTDETHEEIEEIAKTVGVSRKTVYRHLAPNQPS